ncbi:hypothetical protein [Halorussus salinus]|uniref:hypothetical protein n=1 Tax=Halorussus salinus TaxID=1364935 RepID=UPI001091E677|nr:hypothetical protein [Halorussus salinus]
MAPLDWLTPDRLASFLDRFVALVFVALGIAALALGLTVGGGFAVFGVDGFVLLGVCWVLFGAFTWGSHRLTSKPSERV